MNSRINSYPGYRCNMVPAGKVDDLRIELDTAFLSAIGIEVKEDDLLLLYHEIGSSLRQWIGD